MGIKKDLKTALGREVVAGVPGAIEYVVSSGRKALASDTPAAMKSCRVCGERIKKDIQFALGRRFQCGTCGHRTHVHCAASVEEKLCKACVLAPEKSKSRRKR